MLFVDGTNFLARLEKTIGVAIDAQRPPASVFEFAKILFNCFTMGSGMTIQRRYWFGSYRGNDENQDAIAQSLHTSHFQPMLVKAIGRREKGVDMTLAIELLTNAFNRNYDIGWLIAGDADYVRLVTEAKRYGCVIKVAAWPAGLSPSLKLESDEFYDLEKSLSEGYLEGRPSLKEAYKAFVNEAKGGAEAVKARRKTEGSAE